MELCGSLVFMDAENACDCGIGLEDSNVIMAFVLIGSILTMFTVTFWDRKVNNLEPRVTKNVLVFELLAYLVTKS